MTGKKILIAVLFVLMFSDAAYAGAFDVNSIGVKANSMGSAFTGIADDASAVYYNPSGLVFCDDHTWYSQVYGNLYLSKITYQANGIQDKSREKYVVPGFFIARKLKKWAFGFGTYIPYASNIGTVYNDFQDSDYKIESSSGFDALTTVCAFQLSSKLSVGAGLSSYWGKMENEVYQFMEVKSEYNDRAGYGFNVGIMYKITDELSMGLVFRSKVSVDMDGFVKADDITNDSDIEFELPVYYSIGLGYKPNPKLTLGVDYCYMRWKDMDEIEYKTAGIKTSQRTFYENSCRLGLGLAYQFKKDMAIRLGMKYEENATEKQGLETSDDFNILVPSSCDVDLFTYSVGMAYNLSDNTEFSLTGFYVEGKEREYNFKRYSQEHSALLIGFRFKY